MFAESSENEVQEIVLVIISIPSALLRYDMTLNYFFMKLLTVNFNCQLYFVVFSPKNNFFGSVYFDAEEINLEK